MQQSIARTGTIDEARAVHARIPEFSDSYLSVYEERTEGKRPYVLIAETDGTANGYMIGYDQDASFYCWMTGVVPDARGGGLLHRMMTSFMEEARRRGHARVTLKTRNARREMLAYVVRSGFNFTRVDVREDERENDIHLSLTI